MGKIVKFIESNLLPLIRALNENTEEGEFTIGMEDSAPVGGEYYHVMDDEQDDIRENNIISENSTDRRVNSIIKKYSGVDDFNEIRTIRSNILKLIPNARAKNDMYLGAVAMWYLTGSLNDVNDRFKLNYILGKLHQGASFGYGKILNEQDFGMVPFNTMKQIMDELIPSEETENSYKSGKKIQKVGNYTIYRMDSYDDTKYVRSQLSQVHWCIFEDDGTFSYMSEGYTVYICVRDGYENARMMSYDELVEKLLSHGMTNAVESLEENYPKDDTYDDFVFDIAYDGDETAELLFVDNEYELGLPPCDDYGLSMFVVMVSNETYKNGRIVMVYSRYNLPNMFDGGILSESELSNVIGADAMSVFTPNGNVQEQKKINENLEFEVDSSEVDLSSFKKQDSLPSIWKDEDTLDSKVRLKLLDIADDFWDFVNVTWVEPKGIIITGSLCNYNWSDYSDVDLHLIVDFNEIGDREDFVRQYLDSKKNEWNDEHGSLKIYGYPVELYVQNINEDVSAGGIYDLEGNKWIRKPSYDDIDEIDSESDEIKDEAARIMTIIDDMWCYFNKTNDNHKLESLGNDADNLWKKIKDMRKSSLEDGGEMSNGNIVYKYMRRKKYLDKLFDLRAAIYDKVNTITEGVSYDKFREGQAFRYRIIGAMIKDGYLFHGTGSEFDEFESDRIRGEERGVYGYGAYFTNAAYKCEEYGNHFLILDAKDFEFLNISEKVHPEWNIFKEKISDYYKIEAGLDNARSNREYDYYNNLYDKYRSTVDTNLLDRFVSILEKNGITDYNTLNKLVDYSFTNSENKDIQKRISQLYLSMGYDGFVCENQYIIFNFKKLNDNIVKDKEKLISKYSIDESKSTGSKLLTEWDRTDYFEKAKEYFGTTNDLNECGFILPDGEMLDLSSSKGRRGIPHRNVEAIGIGLETFIEHGAIRCDSRYKLINICKRPTKEQIIRLVEIIKANNGSVSLDLGNGHVTFDYVDYKNANYKRIINDIINFFDNKIKPSSLYESKNIIKEYLEKDYNMPLYKYFKWASTASSCEKARDLAYSCSYYINEYIRKIYYRYSEFENLLNDGEFDYEDESLVEMFLNMLEENNLCDHFVSEMQSIVDDYELPSWCTMKFNRIVKNEWCIHFGSDSDSIAKEGFTGGTPDIEHLAYTNAGAQKTSAGYNFAFLINDRNVDYNEYGDEAVIFRTSGVEIYHYGDNQNQVAFWGPNVKSFIPIHQDNGDWVVYGQNGQVLVRCGRPSEIAIWATENLPQYRKQIMTGKNGYIPKQWVYDKEQRKSKPMPYPIYRNESVRKFLILLKENSLNEEIVADGNSEHNPYAKRWKAERDALKNFLKNFGKIMTSKENGKQYKVFQDQALSNLIGYNYCICIQWDPIKMEVGSTPYIRAFDKFTYRIFQAQFDDRGRDNLRATADDIGNSYQPIQTRR
jgi:hypothetical protein